MVLRKHLGVVIPVRNGAATLGALLESLQGQQAPAQWEIELIVVDDGSTDDTAAIAAASPKVRLLRHPFRRGAGAARNTGANACRAEALLFLDVDTHVRDADFLVRCCALLEQLPDCAAFSGCYYDRNPGHGLFRAYLDAVEATMRDDVLDRPAPGCLNGCVCMVRREAFARAGGFSEDPRVTLEDVDLGFRLGQAGYRHWFSGSLRVEHQQPGLRHYVGELIPRARHYMHVIRRYRTLTGVMGGSAEPWRRMRTLAGTALLPAGLASPWAALAGLLLLAASALQGRVLIGRLLQSVPLTALPVTFCFHLASSAALATGGFLGLFDALRFGLQRRLIDAGVLWAYCRTLMAPRAVGYLIHFLTHRCNARCAHCFDHPQRARIAKTDELDLQRIRRLARQAGTLGHVSLTGGEPLLRDDVAEIAGAWYAAGARSLSLASNGSQPERLRRLLPRLVAAAPRARIIVKLSLDGIGAEHDRLRGHPGLYTKLEGSIAAVAAARAWWPQLRLHLCLTLTEKNHPRLDEILAQLKAFAPDQIELNRVRGETADPALADAGNAAYRAASLRVKGLQANTAGLTGWLARLDQAMFEVIARPDREWPCGPCLAGRRLAVIQADGTVLPCEMLRTVRATDAAAHHQFVLGHLDDFADDLQALLAGTQAQGITRYIRDRHCRCSFECAILATMSYRPWRVWRTLRAATITEGGD